MNKQILNVIFILAICFVAYQLFRNLDFKEGMDTGATTSATTSTSNGIAGSAQNYAANIKSTTIKNQDTLLITKYRTDYENAILNLDDLINSMMLQTALSVDNANPMSSLEKLNQLNSAKSALNNVMKYVDASK
uniref:Uncharacterized protein n=1 Tax=viral metagenome TaxID=1070528 RepID=A0A6C0D9Y5_9ZZZZ